MIKCRCGAELNCSCAQRRASDGTMCCTGCVSSYEESLRNKSVVSISHPSPNNYQGTAPVIKSITYNGPIQ